MSTNARVSDMCRLHIDTPAAFVGAGALTKCKPFLKDYGNLKKSLVSLLILYYHICIIKNGGSITEMINSINERRSIRKYEERAVMLACGYCMR